MKQCDLIMKGGLTSGVVYPLAITELAKEYEFVNIGGTSAGAIGAVIAAAAEYRRQTAKGTGADPMQGFEEMKSIPNELGPNLQDLFVPVRPLQPLFNILIALTKTKVSDNQVTIFIIAALKNYIGAILPISLITLFGVTSLLYFSLWGWAAFIGILGMFCVLLRLAGRFFRALTIDLPANNFGLCPGTSVTQPKPNRHLNWALTRLGRAPRTPVIPPFTDWISEKIDTIAYGLETISENHPPLTIGELRNHGIEIASMTTDLSSRRPYQLPLEADNHYFRISEFENLFPKRIVDYLIEQGHKYEHWVQGEPNDLVGLPTGDKMPVLLVARMSLSFPGLISAIPLYRNDHSLYNKKTKHSPLSVCLFSDGGISSNFPVHFFDSLLPSRPTFGINLTTYDKTRHGKSRVDLPKKPRRSHPIYPVKGLGGFFGSILNTAKDWQDTLQALLPGYAERIIEVRLDNNEGGLNLTMKDDVIYKIVSYGQEAGRTLASDEGFNADEHRFRRAISSLPILEETMAQFSRVYRNKEWAADTAISWTEIFETYDPESYDPKSLTWRKNKFHKFVKNIHEIGASAYDRDLERSLLRDRKTVPYTDVNLRLVASPLRMNHERWVLKRERRDHNEF